MSGAAIPPVSQLAIPKVLTSTEIGLVMLIGLITKNGILIVEFAPSS